MNNRCASPYRKSDPPQGVESQFIDQYISEFNSVVEQLEQLYPIRSKVHDYFTTHLPTFIYMDDYRAFRGTAQLDEIQARQANDSLEDADETFLTILHLSGLDLEELVKLGRGDMDETEQRQYTIDDGAATLTAVIEERFRQRRYEVDYDVDNQRFFTFVKDDHDRALIRLEERSKGFQWFFSFDLMLMHESAGTFKGCVILLDEPGLHLHPEAQKDLLLRLDHYAEGNILLYTSHLPFMIDLNHPERIRVLEEKTEGIVVTTNFTGSDPATKFVLQAALGIDILQNSLVTKNNLVVEGAEDYLVFSALSNLLQEEEKIKLPEDLRITPALGASEAVYMATFMIGQGLNVVALFDSDRAGRNAKKKLVEKWITQYNPESESSVIMLGEAVGACHDFALEDLFTEDFFIESVWEVYGEQLEAKGITQIGQITLQGNDMLWKRVERFMKDNGIKINKGPIAKRLARKINSMQKADELPKDTQNYAINLFQKISDALQ